MSQKVRRLYIVKLRGDNVKATEFFVSKEKLQKFFNCIKRNYKGTKVKITNHLLN